MTKHAPQQQLTQLFQRLDQETGELESQLSGSKNGDDQYDHDAFIASLQLSKLGVNLDSARSMVLDLERQESQVNSSTVSPSASATSLLLRRYTSSPAPSQKTTHLHRNHLKRLNDRVQNMQQTVRNVQEHEAQMYKQEQEQRRQQELRELQQEQELKQRRPSNSVKHDNVALSATGSKQNMGMHEKVALQQNMQEEISQGILGMVSTLKQNAQKFNEKVNEDKAVVESATESLNKTSSTMGKVGTRLSQYKSTTALGWKFYLIAAVGMVLALIVGMLLINLFPKW